MPADRKAIFPEVGDLVESRQGRDRYRVFVVIGIDDKSPVPCAVIADGKLHKISGRKRKNFRHIAYPAGVGKVNIKADVDALEDVQIAEICEKYSVLRKKL